MMILVSIQLNTFRHVLVDLTHKLLILTYLVFNKRVNWFNFSIFHFNARQFLVFILGEIFCRIVRFAEIRKRALLLNLCHGHISINFISVKDLYYLILHGFLNIEPFPLLFSQQLFMVILFLNFDKVLVPYIQVIRNRLLLLPLLPV